MDKDKDKPDLKVIDLKTKPSPMAKLKALIKEIEKGAENTFSLFKLEAEFKKKRYDYLIENGFTKEQALELCKGNCLLL